LAAAAFAAGAVNAVAGGGSLISFPALVAVGVPTLAANVTNQIGVLPGYFGGTVAYREELRGQRERVVALSLTSSVGAVVGALLLVISSQRLFEVLAPVLVLVAPLVGATFTLVLSPLLVASLVIAAIVTVLVVNDGESTWLEGSTLVVLYVLIASSFWWG
jgi:uncharacterized membrane protein YfcA